MSKRHDKSNAGRWNGAFQTTHWTEIFDARSGDEARRQATLRELLTRYWKPVYCYLRSKGYDNEEAEDLTQGFFHEVVLGRGLIQQADRSRGRFRTFLLKALDRYATDVLRTEKRKRRMPEGGLVRLEGTDWLSVPEPVHYTTPVEVFDYAWASALLDQVLAEVERQCRETGESVHWEVFRARVVLPIMDNVEPPSLAHLCAKHGISNEAKASNMIITVKRRFQAVLRRHVRRFVDSDADVNDEIRDLMRIFSGGCAGS